MEGKIYEAMAQVMSAIKPIAKDKKCQTGATFKYRGIDDVYNALQPLLADAGIFTLPHMLERTCEERKTAKGSTVQVVTARMKYVFMTTDGSSVEAEVIGEAMDSGDKATNKAMAIAHKYALFQTFCIPTDDMPDPDAEAQELTPRHAPARKAPARQGLSIGQQLKALMDERFGGNSALLMQDIGGFLGREITSKEDTNPQELADYLAAKQNQQVDEVPF